MALGHIHKPQAMGRDMVRYAGSILKYSFSEIHMDKKAAILTIDDKKKISLSFHPLKPLRDMREIECSLEELLKKNVRLAVRKTTCM
ncbi:MAG: metallophosphoesterase family protein [Anaerostipes sp.]